MTAATAHTPSLLNMEVVGQKAFALRPPNYIDNFVLSANVAENFTTPAGANYAIISATENIWVRYITDDEDETVSLTNGTFASDTDWTKGTGWTIAGGKGVATGGISTAISQTLANLVAGRAYLVTFTTSNVAAGSVAVTLGGGTAGASISGNSTQSQTIISGATGGDIAFTGTGFTGEIDTVTVAPIANVPSVDNTSGSGVELNPTVRFISTVDKISLISAATCLGSIAYYT